MSPGNAASSRADSAAVPGTPALPVAGMAALAFAAFGSAASVRVTDPALTRIADEYGVTLAVAAYAITAFALAYGLLQVAFGPAGDRYGKIRVIGFACAASALASACCALAPSFPALVAARALCGAASAAVIPLAMAWIGDVVPYERRQPVLARFLTGQILGLATGGLLGGFAADHLGWRTAFVFLAAWFAVAWLLLAKVRHALPPPVLSPVMEGRSALARMAANMRSVARHRWPRVILAIVFLEGLCLFGAFAFVATHLHRRYGLSLTLAGSVTVVFGLGGLSFAAASHLLLRRLGEAHMAAGGALVIGATFTTIGLVPLQWVAAPCMYLAGLGFYMLHNTLQTHATQMAPAQRGAAVSLFAFCYFVGQSSGVALAGHLLNWIDTGTVIALGGICVTVLGLIFMRLRAGWRPTH